MKTIKKYWKMIARAIVGLFGLIFLISRKVTSNKLDKTEEEIDNNNSKIDKLSGKLERIQEEEDTVKENIKKQKQEVKKAKDKKDKVPVTKRTTADAKKNIIKKTRK